jgi:5-methyltetrahydrofolate--homocysteine methyltransferase
MNIGRDTGQWPHHTADGKFNALWQQVGYDDRHPSGFKQVIQRSIKKNIPLPTVSAGVLDRAMRSSLKKFKDGHYQMPELVMRAKKIGDARDLLVKHDSALKSLSKGDFFVATIKGEYHRHGKDIATCLLRGIGFRTFDLGLGVPVRKIIDTARRHKPDYIGISASILSTVPAIKQLKKRLQAEKRLERTSIIIGGYVAMDDASRSIGAEHYCKNVTETISLLTTLANKSRD